MSGDPLLLWPRECTCEVCHRDYPVWFAPSEVWNPVMRRADGSEVHSFLCPLCFMTLAEQRGIVPTAWRVEPEPTVIDADEFEAAREDPALRKFVADAEAYVSEAERECYGGPFWLPNL